MRLLLDSSSDGRGGTCWFAREVIEAAKDQRRRDTEIISGKSARLEKGYGLTGGLNRILRSCQPRKSRV